MKFCEILKKISLFNKKLEEKYNLRIIIKTGIEVGVPKDFIDKWAKTKEEAIEIDNQVMAVTTIGWKKRIEENQYGNFFIIRSVAEDCEVDKILTIGDRNLDDKIMAKVLKEIEKDYLLFLKSRENEKNKKTEENEKK